MVLAVASSIFGLFLETTWRSQSLSSIRRTTLLKGDGPPDGPDLSICKLTAAAITFAHPASSPTFA